MGRSSANLLKSTSVVRMGRDFKAQTEPLGAAKRRHSNRETVCDILAPVTGPSLRTSAYYSAPVDRFLTTDPHQVLGALAAAHIHDLDVDQRQAWEEEIEILAGVLNGLSGTVFLEFDVPRLGSRIDAVLVSGSALFAIEFKCGERKFRLADYNQAWDYALDLKNFHAASHDAAIFPVLVATQVRRRGRRLAAHISGRRATAVSLWDRHLRRSLDDGLDRATDLESMARHGAPLRINRRQPSSKRRERSMHDTLLRRSPGTTRAQPTCA